MTDDNGGAPALYEKQADGAIALHATRCAHDGLVSFPPERYGCRRCGARGDALRPMTLAARGAVSDLVVVHRHRGPGPEAPFAIGGIRLDDGVVIRALVAQGAGVGTRVRAVQIEDAAGVPWLRFEPEGAPA